MASYKCSNCTFEGCGCKKEIATDGKRCCAKCVKKYNAQLAAQAQTK